MNQWLIILPETLVIFAVWSLGLAALFLLGEKGIDVVGVIVGGLLGFLTKTALDQAARKINGTP
jgi:hypothetical protein